VSRHLLVIGAQRCGTTYLADVLDSHPEIAVARPRRPEPKVFLSDERARRGVEWYRSTYFAHHPTAVVLAEKSTSYLEDAGAGRRAQATLPVLRILVQLRDPVARAVSHWRFSTTHRLEGRPLVSALADSLDGEADWDPERSSVSPFAYLSRGRYAEHLAAWCDRFGDRLRVQFLEDFAVSPRSHAELFDWLGVEPGAAAPVPAEPVNSSAGPPPELPEDLTRRLRQHFAEADSALRELLGRDLPWISEETPR
jgi:hypothetical protein